MKYINHLHPIFESGLRQHAEYEVRLRFWVAQSWLSPFSLFFVFISFQICNAATQALGDMCRYVGPVIDDKCNTYVEIILTNLRVCALPVRSAYRQARVCCVHLALVCVRTRT